MKLLMCQMCGDIISPFRLAKHPRFCQCGRHAVWWENPNSGILRVYDMEGPTVAGPSIYNQRAWVLGISNSFLEWEGRITADSIKQIDDECPDTYLFKRIHSPIIRIRPGETSDTAYSELPIL